MCQKSASLGSLRSSSWLGYSWDLADFADSSARVCTLPAVKRPAGIQSRREKFRQDTGPSREELRWLRIILILRKVSVPSFLSSAGGIDQKLGSSPFGSSESDACVRAVSASSKLGLSNGMQCGEGVHPYGETVILPPSYQLASTVSMHNTHLKLEDLMQDVLWPLAAVGDMETLDSTEITWKNIPESADPMRGSGYKATSLLIENLQFKEEDDSGHGDPCMGRGERKRLQVANIASALSSFQLKGGSRIVDFGCGSGALTLPLAALFPDLSFIGVDYKQQCINLLEERAQKANLQNVIAFHGRIETFSESFDVCVALHACGIATDLALLQALRHRAAYVMSPCCVGKLQLPIQQVLINSAQHMRVQKRFCPPSTTNNSVSKVNPHGKNHPNLSGSVDFKEMTLEGLESNLSLNITTLDQSHQFTEGLHKDMKESVISTLTYPRSRWLRSVISENEFQVLARTADWSSYDHESSVSRLHAVCKVVMEIDRNEASRELGYSTGLFCLSSEKAGTVGVSHVLIGKPKEPCSTISL